MNKQPEPTQVTPRTNALILLIEDDGLIIRMYEKKLQLDGYEVITANDGEEGINKLKAEKPDLVLCDVMMPRVNGFMVLQAAKEDPELAKIPFVMLTNLSDEEQAQRALEMGANTYLIKSNILPADVVAKVKEILKATGAESIPQAVAVNKAA